MNQSFNYLINSMHITKRILLLLPAAGYGSMNTTIFFLGRHFGCRPLDPTRDILSNFVKKSILPPFLKQV